MKFSVAISDSFVAGCASKSSRIDTTPMSRSFSLTR
jgi:hypothetical protein